MEHEVMFAGFGGQGVLLAGRMLVYAGMLAGKEVSWMPSYGPEMRGGTASCSTVISDEPIGCPVVTKPSAMVVMNEPSLERFERTVRQGGVLIINSSLVKQKAARSDIRTYYVPMNDLAESCGDLHLANMVALGALVEATQAVPEAFLQQAITKHFAGKPEVAKKEWRAVALGGGCVAEARCAGRR